MISFSDISNDYWVCSILFDYWNLKCSDNRDKHQFFMIGLF